MPPSLRGSPGVKASPAAGRRCGFAHQHASVRFFFNQKISPTSLAAFPLSPRTVPWALGEAQIFPQGPVGNCLFKTSRSISGAVRS